MPEDRDLLLDYSRTRSEAALAELVRRHVDLVYSAAMRRVGGDHHRATEVTQDVFLSLANHAAQLARHPVLRAWLFASTRHAAANLLRGERRRERRHQEAYTMQELDAPASPPVDWSRLSPLLDAALDELGEKERQAVILRFFDQRSFAEVGAALSLQEDAARKQVGRTLSKLQKLLASRGVASTEAALAAVISTHAVQAAPAGVAATVTSATLAGASVGAGVAISLWPVAKMAIATAVIAGGAGFLWHQRNQARSDPPAPAPVAAPVAPPQPPASGVSPAALQPVPAKNAVVETALAEAIAYDQGKNGPRDATKARAAYLRAAAEGSAAAEYRLGYLHEVGDGVPQDYLEARRHYLRALELGLIRANLRLGILDLEGWGGERDIAAAIRRITAAAEAGDREAQKVLSGMYFAGVGVKPDLAKSMEWATEGAKDDDPAAQVELGLMTGLLKEQNQRLAREWYQLSAEQDYARGMLAMASTFLRPDATPEQLEQGRQWLQLAADRGDGSAALHLAGLYLSSPVFNTRPRAEALARTLLEQSRDRGDYFAGEVLEEAATRSLGEAFKYVMTVPPEERYVTRAAAKTAATKPDASGFTPPVPTKIVTPVYPIIFRLTGTEGEAVIDFHVDTTGRTRDAKVVKSTHPGFGEPAILAVKSWRFTPGQRNGHAINVHLQVPINFRLKGVSTDLAVFKFEIGSIRRTRVEGADAVALALRLGSARPLTVRGSRTIITQAVDAAGTDLRFSRAPGNLYETTVGAEITDRLEPAPVRGLDLAVKAPPDGGVIRAFDGTMELVVPDLDPRSTVVVANFMETLGRPLAHQTLAEEGITMVVYDQATAERLRPLKSGEGGPQDYDAGPMFGEVLPRAAYAQVPPEVLRRMRVQQQMTPTQLAVGIADPQGHLVALEFRDKDGQPLRYVHSGFYHSSGLPGKPERRFVIFDLLAPIPADTQLVAYVATHGARLPLEFHFKDLVVPPAAK